MLTPYRLEIFTRDYEFKALAPVLSTPSVEFDYLTISTNYVTVKDIVASKGDYARIINSEGVLYEGIVTDIELGKTSKRLTIAPFISLLDVDFMPEPYEVETIEEQLAAIISQALVNNEDVLQNIAGLTITTLSETAGALVIDKDSVNIFELTTQALGAYGIACNFSLDVSGALNLTIGVPAEHIIIEADLSAVLASSFIIGDGYGELNKLICLYTHEVPGAEGEEPTEVTETLTFYRHTNGEIDQEDADRITPVVWAYADISVSEGETFEENATNKARETLAAKYKNEITIQTTNQSRIIKPMQIGQQAEIIKGSDTYTSILTGYEKGEGVITYTFGTVRTTLTKKLWLKNRGI